MGNKKSKNNAVELKINPAKVYDPESWGERTPVDSETPWIDEDWDADNYDWLFSNYEAVMQANIGKENNQYGLKSVLKSARFETLKIILLLKRHPGGLSKEEIIQLGGVQFALVVLKSKGLINYDIGTRKWFWNRQANKKDFEGFSPSELLMLSGKGT